MKNITATSSSNVWCFASCLLALIIVVILLPGYQGHRYQIPSFSSRAIGWLRGKDKEAIESRDIPLGPDLSTCHPTLSEAGVFGHMIDCCPSVPDSEKPVTEFQFPDPSSPLRIRRPAHLVDEDYLAKYNKAVAIMKRLPPDHPHSFSRQAKIHCLYCNGVYYQANTTGDVPFVVHGSWLFFPFHRFYVYFHERILGKLIGDDTFAIPYWNYDSPDGMPIPDIYMKGELNDQERDSRHLPPTFVDINYTPERTSLDPEPVADQVATNFALMYNHMVSGATKPELFMGCKLKSGKDGTCSGMGTIEDAPHNTVHLWTGNRSRPEFEDMGTLYKAAHDPIFFAHHANLDRFWEVWRKFNGYTKSVPEFNDPQWLDSYFYFYDENLNLVRAKVRDSFDADKLRYAYEEVDLPWFYARPKPSVPPRIARNILRSENDNMLRMATNKGPWTLEETVRVRVTRPTRSRAKEEEEVLVVQGISVENDMYAKFDVYINLVDDAIASATSREFAGCFVKMKGDIGMAMKGKRHMKIGISEILEDLEADKDESIWVSLVPRGGTGNVTTVQEIRIEYMK